MKIPYLKAVAIVVMLVSVLSLVPIGRTQSGNQDYVSTFLLQNHPNGELTYQLNVSIPYDLHQYYTIQNHFLFSPADFPKYVTPYTLKPIADRLWQIYDNKEDFTNGVLMLVHQITYKQIDPAMYPVETFVAKKGDCDLFAYIAASILEAGGIPTVILYYKDKEHMEIAVDLGSTPKDARNSIYSVTYENVTYYIAECTGGNWRQGWRVGECPADYQNASSQVVTLEGMSRSSIGQVSASINQLDSSTLTMQVSSNLLMENNQLTINGQILPQTADENVTLQASVNGGGWTTIATVETEPDGRYAYNWTPSVGGSIAIQASWQGNMKYNGAISAQYSVMVMPYYFVALLFSTFAAFGVLMVAFVKTRNRKTKIPTLPSAEDNPQTVSFP